MNDTLKLLRRNDYCLFILQADPAQAHLLRVGAAATGVSAHVLNVDVAIEAELTRLAYASTTKGVLLVDLASLDAQAGAVAAALVRLRQRQPDLRVICFMADRLLVSENQRAYIAGLGGSGLFANCSALRLAETLIPVLALALEVPAETLAPIDFARFVRVMRIAAPSALEPYHATWKALTDRGINLPNLMYVLQGPMGVEIRDRNHQFKSYPDCFIGKAATDVLMNLTEGSREFALAVGKLLLRCGVFHHVADNHDFEDGEFFYRFSTSSERVAAIDLASLLARADSANGMMIENRHYRGKTYPQCFLGNEAVIWLRQNYRLSRAEALAVGQQLIELKAWRHVANDRQFVDWAYFYRFASARTDFEAPRAI